MEHNNMEVLKLFSLNGNTLIIGITGSRDLPLNGTLPPFHSYIGRKALHWQDELLVPGSTILARPAYSYWTLGYLISHSGAEKLVNARPFRNLLPVDEYIPIMFNVHPE